MAFITFCEICRTNTTHGSMGCLKCKENEIKKNKEFFLNVRSKMTIEERLMFLESDYFDHKINHPSNPMIFA